MIFQGRSFWYALQRCLSGLGVGGWGYHVEEEHVKVLKSGVEMLATAMLVYKPLTVSGNKL